MTGVVAIVIFYRLGSNRAYCYDRKNIMNRVIWRSRYAIACSLLALAVGLTAAQGPTAVYIRDSDGHSVAGARVTILLDGHEAAAAMSDEKGEAAFPSLLPAPYELSVSKEGFETAHQQPTDWTQPVRVTLTPAAQHDSVKVMAQASSIDSGSSSSTDLPAKEVKELPSRPATVADALPMVPGVVRKPDGGLEISGSPEHRASLIVNSADVTDPATGQFGLTVPIDSVQSVTVYQTPFVAEYGRFTAGLVSVETRRGGDEWKWELNDPFPDFAIRSWHLRGLRDATPRLNAEGPIVRNKLFFSEGLEYEVRKVEVHTLPFPFDQKKNEGFNSFAQLDWIKSDKQLVTLTLHAAPQRIDYNGLDYYNPEPVTPDANTRNYTVTLGDKWSLWGGLLDNTLSATRFGADVWGQGSADMTLSPSGNGGNYFETQRRYSTRAAWSPTFAFKPVKSLGLHEFKVGAYEAYSMEIGQVFEHPIDILDTSGALTQQISFFGGREFRMSDTEFAAFAQDHWTVSKRLAFDFGVRAESQEVSDSFRVAPRAGFVWNPLASTGTVVRGGFGEFYDRVPLNVYAFNYYPKESVQNFLPDGEPNGNPFIFANTLGVSYVHSFWVFRHPGAGDFSPQSATASFQVEQPVTRFVQLRASYMENRSDGLVVMNTIAPDPASLIGNYELTGDGASRYRQLALTARVRAGENREIFVSYVSSRARGDINDFASYLGSFPIPIIRPNSSGVLPTDLPNRFLAWGSVKLPDGFRVSPVVELRSGFPYSSFDAAQNYVGMPYGRRYPMFFSVDSRLSKDIKVSAKYTVRLSVSDFNLTNHFNPEAVHYNIAGPAYGLFFGQRGRRFTADFDVLF